MTATFRRKTAASFLPTEICGCLTTYWPIRIVIFRALFVTVLYQFNYISNLKKGTCKDIIPHKKIFLIFFLLGGECRLYVRYIYQKHTRDILFRIWPKKKITTSLAIIQQKKRHKNGWKSNHIPHSTNTVHKLNTYDIQKSVKT